MNEISLMQSVNIHLTINGAKKEKNVGQAMSVFIVLSCPDFLYLLFFIKEAGYLVYYHPVLLPL